MTSKKNQSNKLADEVASFLFKMNAINFRPKTPYKFTSGWTSPVYIDCRSIISFLDIRRRIMNLSVALLKEKKVINDINFIAGGETAGIPYASWISDLMDKPMLYIRKSPKGFGRNAQIEGRVEIGDKVLLVEDLATDGGSKLNFINAIRNVQARVTDVFVIFFYDIFPNTLNILGKEGVTLHYLCTWHDVLRVAKKENHYNSAILDEVSVFLDDPISWSKQHGGRG